MEGKRYLKCKTDPNYILDDNAFEFGGLIYTGVV